MSDELLMDLADCGSPEKIIAAILKHHPLLEPPIPIRDLAEAVGIIKFQELSSDGFEGALVTDADKQRGAILYRSDRPPGRQRFTIAHELGHFLIPSHKGSRQCTPQDMRETGLNDPARRMEAEANRFAAGMLMPKPLFAKDLQRLGDVDVSHAQTLARLYDTSLEATINRYRDVTDDTCAFVFSKDGVIRYVRATQEFPHISVWAKDPLPASSLSAKLRLSTSRDPSTWEQIDASVWLSPSRSRLPPNILEQTLVQDEGYQVTLLVVDQDTIGEEDNGEDEDLLDRFGLDA